MDDMFDIIDGQINSEPFLKIAVSDPIKKDVKYFKITVVPHKKNDVIFYQFTLFFETKVRHENYYTIYDMKHRLHELALICYQQWEIVFAKKLVKILFNKRGKHKIITHNKSVTSGIVGSHNKQKKYLISEGTIVPWLTSLGVMNKEGIVFSDKQRKFRQINRFLEMVSDVSHAIPQEPVIVDYGCGKSYLTFALYDYLDKIDKSPRILGLDLKADVISNCQNLAQESGFSGLNFKVGDMREHDMRTLGQVNMVVSLHACDTATDYVLANAIKNNVDVILSVPCCQHELFKQIKSDELSLILKHGIFKERFSSILTDSLRAGVLEACGYKCQVIEFIDKEDTPKNVMIRAVRKRGVVSQSKIIADIKQLDNVLKLKERFSVEPTILKLLGLEDALSE